MKNYKNQLVCIYHKQPITKIQKLSKRLLCPQCQQQSQQQFHNRLQVLRAKLTTNYSQQLGKLKNLKQQIQKTSDIFINHNMIDAKRKIKKQLPAIQALVDALLQKQIEDANRSLRLYVDKLLKPWNGLDGRKFQMGYLEFERAHPELLEAVDAKKKELRDGIAVKLKAEVFGFYCRLFDL